MAKLDPKYKIFIHAYFYEQETRGNAEQAAIKAGFAEKTARARAAQWVGKSRQKSANKILWDLVDAERKKLEKEYGIKKQEIVDGYIRDERFDPINLVDPDSGLVLIDLREIPKETRLSLRGMKIKETIIEREDGSKEILKSRTIEFKYPDKKGNRDSLAKIKGMFIEKHEHKVDLSETAMQIAVRAYRKLKDDG